MYTNNDWRYYSELSHHGILGQKWGRKMGPPYPLDAGDHSAAEKKAGWRKSLTDDAKSAIRKTASTVKNVKTLADKNASAEEKTAAGKDVAKTAARVGLGAAAGAAGSSLGAAAGVAATGVFAIGTAGIGAVAAPVIINGMSAAGAYAGYKLGYSLSGKAIDKGSKFVKDTLNESVPTGDKSSVTGGQRPSSKTLGKAYNSTKEAKQAYRDRNKALQDEYDKEEARIESKYKRGQKMSTKDVDKELEASRRLDESWSKSKEQYKADVKATKQSLRQKKAEDNKAADEYISNAGKRKTSDSKVKTEGKAYNSVKDAKKAKQDRDDKIQAEYDRVEKSIYSKLGKYEMPSKKDLERLSAAEDKAWSESKKSIEQYKADVKTTRQALKRKE